MSDQMSMTDDDAQIIEHIPPGEGPGDTTSPQPRIPEEGSRALTVAAAQVPVKVHGAAPENFAHQITLAQYMAKAELMVPQHFHGNVGDCLAIIDIAQRAGLSPYMVAAKTYKNPSGKGIAFESQLYHAFLIGSGSLEDRALHSSYEGEAGERKCKIWGTLRGEKQPREYTTPPLKQLHPGYTLSTQDGNTKTKRNLPYEEGQRLKADPNFKGHLSVTGSPLWDDKPDVQQFYDGSRDWGRMFSPISTLGMLAQYETIEHPIAPITLPAESTLQDRLKNGDKTEGHQDGHAADELTRTAADNTALKPAGGGETAKIKPAKAEGKKGSGKPPAERSKFVYDKRTTSLEKDKAPTAKQTSAAADRAQAMSDSRKREADEKKAAAAAKKPEQKTDDPPPPVPIKPKNDAEYAVYCRDWIDRTNDPETAIRRWDAELQMRDDIVVRIPTRNNLREYLERKHGI